MTVIEEARAALDVDPVRLTRVARKHGIDTQEAAEKIAWRRSVLDRGGKAAAHMASVILGRTFKGVGA